MADNTSYTVEAYDSVFAGLWDEDDDPEKNWSPLSEKSFDTFSEAEEASKTLRDTYRGVRIRKHVYSLIALYQDGVEVE